MLQIEINSIAVCDEISCHHVSAKQIFSKITPHLRDTSFSQINKFRVSTNLRKQSISSDTSFSKSNKYKVSPHLRKVENLRHALRHVQRVLRDVVKRLRVNDYTTFTRDHIGNRVIDFTDRQDEVRKKESRESWSLPPDRSHSGTVGTGSWAGWVGDQRSRWATSVGGRETAPGEHDGRTFKYIQDKPGFIWRLWHFQVIASCTWLVAGLYLTVMEGYGHCFRLWTGSRNLFHVSRIRSYLMQITQAGVFFTVLDLYGQVSAIFTIQRLSNHGVLFNGTDATISGSCNSPLPLEHSPLRDRLVYQPAHVEVLHARALEAVGGGQSENVALDSKEKNHNVSVKLVWSRSGIRFDSLPNRRKSMWNVSQILERYQ